MKVPPNRVTVEMKEEDVQKNLVDIIKGMDFVRKECLANLGLDDQAKLDYLRFSNELASCIEPKLADVNANQHARRIVQYVDRDPLLLRYDDIQYSFWERRQPKFRDLLDRTAILLLRDDFNSTTQAYHVFQGVKHLYINPESQEAVYDTILPFNSLLSEVGLEDPLIAKFLMQHLFQGFMQQCGNGLVLSDKSFNDPELVERLRELGALHVDLPQSMYSRMKAKYPNTVVIEDGKEKRARVYLRDMGESINDENIFDFFTEYAAKELSKKAEKSLKPGIRTHFSFGKKFVEEMEEEMGVTLKPEPRILTRNNGILTLDDVAAEGSANHNQDYWIEFWNKAGNNLDGKKWLPDLPDIYQWGRQVKENPKLYEAVLESLRTDFKERWVLLSTRFEYEATKAGPQNEWVTIKHRYGSSLPREPIRLEAPVYRNTPIRDVLNDSEKGRPLVCAALGTDDTNDEIIDVLKAISGKPEGKIRFWTPAFDGDWPRYKHPNRAVSLTTLMAYSISIASTTSTASAVLAGCPRAVASGEARSAERAKKFHIKNQS